MSVPSGKIILPLRRQSGETATAGESQVTWPSLSFGRKNKWCLISAIRELEQRRLQRERQKRLPKQQLCSFITLFCTFIGRPLHDYDVKVSNFTFWGERERKTTFFSFSSTSIQSFRIIFHFFRTSSQKWTCDFKVYQLTIWYKHSALLRRNCSETAETSRNWGIG